MTSNAFAKMAKMATLNGKNHAAGHSREHLGTQATSNQLPVKENFENDTLHVSEFGGQACRRLQLKPCPSQSFFCPTSFPCPPDYGSGIKIE